MSLGFHPADNHRAPPAPRGFVRPWPCRGGWPASRDRPKSRVLSPPATVALECRPRVRPLKTMLPTRTEPKPMRTPKLSAEPTTHQRSERWNTDHPADDLRPYGASPG
ncbi:hypothetical protein GCM10010116_26370 [Microbispora rosea subsp. aerata]|nr:hypothetical protein GCM10010116_26370 [Microbispora rosea subsp. aerata]GIH58445.1 hypothetical protein Mro02_53590 [Microbispora rosea subsp. aerata]GLJ85173.1 hypothetical protein GCM10017588_39010 [Microbispora rosea subsp. aerata]